MGLKDNVKTAFKKTQEELDEKYNTGVEATKRNKLTVEIAELADGMLKMDEKELLQNKESTFRKLRRVLVYGSVIITPFFIGIPVKMIDDAIQRKVDLNNAKEYDKIYERELLWVRQEIVSERKKGHSVKQLTDYEQSLRVSKAKTTAYIKTLEKQDKETATKEAAIYIDKSSLSPARQFIKLTPSYFSTKEEFDVSLVENFKGMLCKTAKPETHCESPDTSVHEPENNVDLNARNSAFIRSDSILTRKIRSDKALFNSVDRFCGMAGKACFLFGDLDSLNMFNFDFHKNAKIKGSRDVRVRDLNKKIMDAVNFVNKRLVGTDYKVCKEGTWDKPSLVLSYKHANVGFLAGVSRPDEDYIVNESVTLPDMKYKGESIANKVKFIMDVDNLPSAVTYIAGRMFRVRVETLIFKDGKIFAEPKSTKTQYGINYKIPGGSIEDNISLEESCAKECHEEAKVNIENTTYTGLYYITDYNGKYPEWHVKKLHPAGIKYEGAVTMVFVADYKNPYTGKIDELDKDELSDNGNWIDPNTLPLSKIHKTAVMYHDDPSSMQVTESMLTEGVTQTAQDIVRKGVNAARSVVPNEGPVKTLDRVTEPLDNIVNTTIDDFRSAIKSDKRDEIIDGKVRIKLTRVIGKCLAYGTLGVLVHPAVAAIAFLGKMAYDKSLDGKERGKIINDLHSELAIVKEKIKDADSKGDNENKYKLMRIENQLERQIARIQYKDDNI